MKVRVLSAGGSVGPDSDVSCFLLDDHILLDVGSAASTLSQSEQEKLSDVLITHPHLDHVRDLPFLCENLFGRIDHSLTAHADHRTIECLRNSLFNGKLWPDFTALPPQAPILRLREFTAGKEFFLGKLEVLAVEMPHQGGSVGFILESETGALAVSGDTGPGSSFWEELVPYHDRLRGILIECSFPDRLESLAQGSGHLCPRLLRTELDEAPMKDTPIYVYAIKGPSKHETIEDITRWANGHVEILEAGRVLEF